MRGRRRSIQRLRECTHMLRMCQTNTETPNQAAVAPINTAGAGCFGRSPQTIAANAIIPMLPMAAPAASTPATFLPRIAPCNPARSFFSFCSFSSNVALAGKIAGKAINRPPTAGPYLFAMIPARTQMAPPNTNRRANWYHFAWRSADKLTLIFKNIYLSSKNQRPRETTNHTGIRLTVTERLDHWPFISSQVAQEA